MPKEIKNFEVEFYPTSEGEFNDVLKIHTHSNPYEKFDINLKGICYFEILSFENLEEKSDLLIFNDIILKEEDKDLETIIIENPMQVIKNGSRIVYDMSLPCKLHPKIAVKEIEVKNYGSNCVRYEWKTNSEVVSIKPSVGHLGAYKNKKFEVRIHKFGELKSFEKEIYLEFGD